MLQKRRIIKILFSLTSWTSTLYFTREKSGLYEGHLKDILKVVQVLRDLFACQEKNKFRCLWSLPLLAQPRDIYIRSWHKPTVNSFLSWHCKPKKAPVIGSYCVLKLKLMLALEGPVVKKRSIAKFQRKGTYWWPPNWPNSSPFENGIGFETSQVCTAALISGLRYWV